MQVGNIFKTLFLMIACISCDFVHAGVVVGGTRVVYNGDKHQASLSVKNTDNIPYLIQAWADANGAFGGDKGAAKPPFIITPPLFRLDADNENILQIIRTGGNLPEDRESIFWLNIKSIPGSAATDKNVLQISVKTRIKMFYRPGNLPAPTEADYNKVSFHREGAKIRVDNPTPYYISFFSINAGNDSMKINSTMAPPKGSAVFTGTSDNIQSHEVKWKIINDFGGNSKEMISPLQ